VSTARARANHKLYLARIVLNAWSDALAAEQTPAKTLGQAFAGAAREHLVQAYGWFLLQISDPSTLPELPPRGCAELPRLADGKAVPGEIREFIQLESEGWIADLLAQSDEWGGARGGAGSSSINLAAAAPDMHTPETFARWADQLDSLFERMSDSLDEY